MQEDDIIVAGFGLTMIFLSFIIMFFGENGRKRK